MPSRAPLFRWLRLIVGGGPLVPGRTMAEKLTWLRKHGEALRTLLMLEPRGHADMYGCFLVPPDNEGADLGVLFWHKDGYSTACGHGTIALATGLWREAFDAAQGDAGFAKLLADAVKREGLGVSRPLLFGNVRGRKSLLKRAAPRISTFLRGETSRCLASWPRASP
mgnify:CR=1 FL=1